MASSKAASKSSCPQGELLAVDLIKDTQEIDPAPVIRHALFTENNLTADEKWRRVSVMMAHNTYSVKLIEKCCIESQINDRRISSSYLPYLLIRSILIQRSIRILIQGSIRG